MERTILESAQILLAAGCCVLPATREGGVKKPDSARMMSGWRTYQGEKPSDSQLKNWFGGRAGATSLCIVCGDVSGGLEMLDFDSGACAYDEWIAEVEKTSPGLTSRLIVEHSPSGGLHVVYRCEETDGNTVLAARPRGDGKNDVLIETRGEGGLFLCAPSPGYRLSQGSFDAIPIVTKSERQAMFHAASFLDEREVHDIHIPQQTPIQPRDISLGEIRPGDDFCQRGDLRPFLLENGWTLTKRGENEEWARPGKTSGCSATLRDGVFYVFTSSTTCFQENVGYSIFAAYARLQHGGDYVAAAAALSAEGYGVRGDPHSDIDISGIIGGQIVSTVDMAAPTTDIEDRFPDGATLEGTWAEAKTPIVMGPMYPHERRPVVHGILRESETMNVIAGPKARKSWLTMDFALSIATGTKWLGKYKTERGNVLILDNELHPETSMDRLPRIANARGLSMADYGYRIAIENMRGELRSIDNLGPYFDKIQPGMFKVIILDALYRFMPPSQSENDNNVMREVYDTLDRHARRLGCSFVLIHHTSKGSQGGKDVTDVGAGAGSQSRAADVHLILRPHDEDDVVVMDAVLRTWLPIEPTCLRWDFPVFWVDNSLDPDDLKQERGRRGAKKEQKPKKEPIPVERFVEIVLRNEPEKKETIIERAKSDLDMAGRMADRKLQDAVNLGLAGRVVMKGRGAPFGFFRSDETDPWKNLMTEIGENK